MATQTLTPPAEPNGIQDRLWSVGLVVVYIGLVLLPLALAGR